ncbi:hypothetical protein [Apilactobacillus ozensis]|uniref:hypothetical protein n=1 Tax=Apilactobacillus ozensis TaxID=866801 RepID=UPI00200A65ED|nr:hypothetical protein [Apilactobacillus ozensis]MCK8606548.1 hypothetical protein [Apilactobacillus ozensis]
MKNLLNPSIINMVLNNDINIKLAVAVLKDNWDDIYDANPIYKRKISVQNIDLAKQIFNAKIIGSKLDFSNYASVHKFIVKNDSFLEDAAKNLLLISFK